MSETFVRQWLETYNSGNLDRCMECYTDDVEFIKKGEKKKTVLPPRESLG